jgi:hypothetical protein
LIGGCHFLNAIHLIFSVFVGVQHIYISQIAHAPLVILNKATVWPSLSVPDHHAIRSNGDQQQVCARQEQFAWA